MPIILREVAVGKEKGKGCYKPAGFWYEVDGDWRRWCEGEDFGCGAYLHAVSLNDCNVLFLDSLTKLDEFHDEYGVNKGIRYSNIEIDWPRLAEIYDGLEIAPYRWERRLEEGFMWYYGWDCASGVIWRPKNAAISYIGEYKPAKSKQEVFGQTDPEAPISGDAS